MPERRGGLASVVAAVALAIVATVLESSRPAVAATADQWRAGHLISDAAFFDGDAMSAVEVQKLLQEKGAKCVAGASPCLKDYQAATPSTAGEAGLCSALPATTSSTAAQMIYAIGRACGISQRVISVMITKESGLVTTSSPTKSMYQTTTGFACPDTAPCNTAYYGFFNQVYRMARQFKYYAANPTRYGYQKGRTNTILYNPKTACGSGSVYIENQATANLYIYTPYQPNKAALANLYGTGDSCSAYGNRNFWRLYSDWFGAPVAPPPPPALPVIDPQGALESVTGNGDGTVRLQGWAYDGSRPTTGVQVRLAINGQTVATATANGPRPELASYGLPGDHGFDVSIPVPASGPSQVCATAVNLDGGADVAIGCRTPAGNAPLGGFHHATYQDGTIAVSGWAADPDAWSSPVVMRITANGTEVARVPANLPRPDLAYYGIFGDHGLDAPVTAVANGANTVCVTAESIYGGSDSPLGCLTVEAQVPQSPIGQVESVIQDNFGTVIIRGHAFDPSDMGKSISTTVSAGGSVIATSSASLPRPDLANYGVTGDHGFQTSFMPPASGGMTYCVAAQNIGPGATQQLGCRAVTVRAPGSPVGAIESVTRSGSTATVTGWAWDPSVSGSPVPVMLTVDGKVAAFTSAGRPKGVLALYGIYGDHGYSAPVNAPAGSDVCVFLFNEGPGESVLSECRTV